MTVDTRPVPGGHVDQTLHASSVWLFCAIKVPFPQGTQTLSIKRLSPDHWNLSPAGQDCIFCWHSLAESSCLKNPDWQGSQVSSLSPLDVWASSVPGGQVAVFLSQYVLSFTPTLNCPDGQLRHSLDFVGPHPVVELDVEFCLTKYFPAGHTVMSALHGSKSFDSEYVPRAQGVQVET